MEHNVQEACNRLVVQEIPCLTDKLVNKEDCVRHSKYFTGCLTLNIPSLGRQRCLLSSGPRRTPCFFFVISQLFDAVDYSNYVFWVSETIIQ